MKFRYLAAASLLAAIAMPAKAQTAVDLELALLVDVSGSVDDSEFTLQRQGYINAFNSASLQNVFASGRTAAVTFVYWSGATEQQQAVGWTLINSAASSAAFATAIGNAARPFAGQTAIGAALAFATPLFGTNAFTSARQIIDVSGDGTNNDGISVTSARDAALLAGVDAINGLPIGDASLTTYFQNNVQGGAGSFTIAADSFADFNAAVALKIGREITNPGGVPEPATWAMMVGGFGAVGFVMRRRPARRLQTAVA